MPKKICTERLRKTCVYMTTENIVISPGMFAKVIVSYTFYPVINCAIAEIIYKPSQ